MLLVAHLQLEFNASPFFYFLLLYIYIYMINLYFYSINALFCHSIGTFSSFLHSYISTSILSKFLPFVCVTRVCFVYWLTSVQRNFFKNSSTI